MINSVLFVSTDFQQKIRSQTIKQERIIDINWSQITYYKGSVNHGLHLKICKKRWIKECERSLKDKELPVIPIVVKKNNKKWNEWVKIINIESQNVYVGLQFGYDIKNVFKVLEFIKLYTLCADLTNLIIQFYAELEVKLICLDHRYIINHCSSESSKKIMKYGADWITDIDITDFEIILKDIAERYEINKDLITECFDKNCVNYLYLQRHTRQEFISLLSSFGIESRIGRMIYQEFF